MPAEGRLRSTRDRGASFEAPLRGAPQDEGGEDPPFHPPKSLADRLLDWRDRLVASPRFQRWAAAFPLTRPIARRQAASLFDLCAGFVYSQVLLATVELRLLERLAGEPRTVEELAPELGLNPDMCRRLLGAAAALGLLERRSGGRFGLGMLGAAMRGNPGIAAMVAHHPMLYGDLAEPVALLRRGGGAGALARYWPYAGPRAADAAPLTAAEVGPYSALMSASQPLVADEVLDAYPVGRHRALLDVGAGDGTFLAAAARRAPDLRLVAFDLPAVAELARARFAREGLATRAEAVGGDFLADPLPRGCDAVSLVRVIHDHDDGPALAILRAARAALAPGGTLILAEPMADGGGPVGEAYFAFYLLAMGSGRARGSAELAAMLREAGFGDIRPIPTHTPMLTKVMVAQAR